MKRKLIMIVLIVLSLNMFSSEITVFAINNPTMDVKIEGIEGKYYLDLIIEDEYTYVEAEPNVSEFTAEFLPYVEKLVFLRNPEIEYYKVLDDRYFYPDKSKINFNCQDEDEIFFDYNYNDCKIIIIKENFDVIITDTIQITEYNTKLKINLSQENLEVQNSEDGIYSYVGVIEECIPEVNSYLNMLVKIITMLLFEIFFARLLFAIKNKKTYKLIIIANIITFVVVQIVGLSIFVPNSDFEIIEDLLFIPIIIECAFYFVFMKGYSKKRIIVYGILINIMSSIITFYATLLLEFVAYISFYDVSIINILKGIIVKFGLDF